MRKGIVTVVLICVAVMSTAGAVSQGQPTAPSLPYTPTGWDQAKRHAFYTTSIGIWAMPYDWFKYLEVPKENPDKTFGPSGRMFRDLLVARFGAIPFNPDDPRDTLLDPKFNPDGFLPVGFIKSAQPVKRPFLKDKLTGQPHRLLNNVYYLGQTCASCHTGMLTYNGKVLRVDGGSGMFDVLSYSGGMIKVLSATMQSPELLQRFATRLGQKPQDVQTALAVLLSYFNEVSPLSEHHKKALYPNNWGFGRGDAFGRGGNTTLGALVPDDTCASYVGQYEENCHKFNNANRVAADSPVSNPHIWNAWKYDRVEWNGSISNPMGRNIAQAITTSRRLFFKNLKDLYLTEPPVDLRQLNQIERLMWDLTPPTWPQEFGAVNGDVVARGKTLYGVLCAKCHVPTKMERPNTFMQELVVNMIGSGEIGTDPNMAAKFRRPVQTGALKTAFARPEASAKEVMERITSGMMERAIKRKEAPHGMIASPNKWDDPAAYIARPNVGVWATPPFLHNGSVPNLYLLLSPASERSAAAKAFCLESFAFDPNNVGYEVILPVSGQCPRRSVPYDTELDGNANVGHEYVGSPDSDPNCKILQEERDPKQSAVKGVLGCKLEEADRRAIIEYLKVCDDC